MNVKGIEVHEFQKPRRTIAKNKRELKQRQKFFCVDQPHIEDMNPITPRDRMWIAGCMIVTACFWGLVIWAFS